MKTVFLGMVLGALGACATSSGVIPFGKDTYTITASAEGGTARAKRDALTEANAYCASRGLVMMPVNAESSERFSPGFASDTLGSYDLIFRCLSESDEDYQRTTPDRPDVVIENR